MPSRPFPFLSESAEIKLKNNGFQNVDSLHNIHIPSLFEFLPFEQIKKLLIFLSSNGVPFTFDAPDWNENRWHEFVTEIVDHGLASWQDVAMTLCGALNPPQVGTAIASNKSFQKKFEPRETMKNVMAWFYSQEGVCKNCGTHLALEADHIKSKEEFVAEGRDIEDADTLDNLQLLCKRCNVIKRPSHALGGISFAPAQSVLIWILLAHRPSRKSEFYSLCRRYGLTMANIRFDEGWAFAEWLSKKGRYTINEG